MNRPEASGQPAPAPSPPSRRRLRYLLPRFDATVVLRAEVPRLAGRPPTLPAATYRMAEPQEILPRLEKLPPTERKSALRRLAAADAVVYTAAGDDLAFWEFVQLGRAEVPPEVWRPGGEGKPAYIFGAFTRAPYRGQGLFTGGLEWLIGWLGEHGYTDLFSQTATQDVGALLAHLTTGFEAVGEGRHLHWLGRRRVRRTRLLTRPVAAGHAEEQDWAALSPAAREALRRALLRRR